MMNFENIISNDDTLLEQLDPDPNLFDDMIPHDKCRHVDFCELGNILKNSHNDFSILNYNVRSFHTNGNALIAAIDSIDTQFDCIVLSETWNTEDNYVLCNLPGYSSFHTFRPLNHIYSISGGVSVFCNDITVKNKTLNKNLSICDANIES